MAIEIHTREVLTPPAPSASVMVLRDGPQGLEVLLVKRHGNSKVLGGVHVFPGGKLDEADCAVPAQRLDQSPEALQQALGEDGLEASQACGLHVAALRETFEECGLLLHEGHAQGVPELLRQRLQSGEEFLQATASLGLQLQTRRIHPWSRWITPRKPSVSDRRFDTRFFVALAPSDHEAEHDAHEVTETVWVQPEAALRDYWDAKMGLVPVQIITLMQLARHGSTSEVLAAARARPPMQIQPEPHDIEGQRVICYPGDPLHPVREPAWVGPTRLTWRQQRFEPEGGLQALLARPTQPV